MPQSLARTIEGIQNGIVFLLIFSKQALSMTLLRFAARDASASRFSGVGGSTPGRIEGAAPSPGGSASATGGAS